ncbi:Cytochrome b561/ferric reductase transmembrane [Penicillium expansum]|uniref:Cytochrome b561/ferric reductase transmembrane n=1 Tax=Penicillium expansum TaxID=27334 RepID=A0A0A2I151_PENEN|nr:Cytochrome b561/ferric reductase transmembrane [Penicillium expansum]KGO36208.1 Cytochrome b561/ferric reductase transmembrane [Penicillium expansum]KGO62068.1 Cytochrome b561/ferric reductase transmembrane [Penicillium expansum]
MVLKVSCILLLEVLIKSTLSQPLTFVVPGRDDIAYHISETDATYIQITASKDVGWVSLSQGQDSPNSSDVAASNTIFVSLKEKYSKKAGSDLPNCQMISGKPSVHDGAVQATIRCDDYSILNRLESFTWAYEKEGTVQYGPMRVLEGHDSSNVATTGHDGLRRVVRSTESTETSTVPAQTPSPEEIAALMARYDRLMKIRTIHGSMMAIGFVVLFPAFASLIHLLPGSKPVIKIHASLQAITAILVIVSFGLGVYLNSQVTIKGKHHQAIGALVVILLVIVQPILGIRQHMLFRKTQQKTKWAYAHRWQGRIMLGLGVVNGGIGLNLSRSGSGDSRGALIGYGVVTGIVYVGYFGILAFKAFNARQNPQGDKSDIPERAVRTGTEEHNLTEIPAHN